MPADNLPEGVQLLDSLGDIRPDNTSPILVCGSHCGGNRALAAQLKQCHFKAVFLNNAGVGKNQAGTRGLLNYQAENVLACAVCHNSAEIGVAHDTWKSGIISHLNPLAQASGICIGDSVQTAVAKIIHQFSDDIPVSVTDTPGSTQNADHNNELKQQTQTQVDGVPVTLTDSITFLNETNANDIVVCGSHGGISAGHYAQNHSVRAVFFNDAGIGKNNAGIKSLESLSQAGILACTVDCNSAEIFNGQDTLDNGILSVCNSLAIARGIQKGMPVKAAIPLIPANKQLHRTIH